MSGSFSDMFGTCLGSFSDMFGTCLGHVLDMLDMFGKCFCLDMFWTRFGVLLDGSGGEGEVLRPLARRRRRLVVEDALGRII